MMDYINVRPKADV